MSTIELLPLTSSTPTNLYSTGLFTVYKSWHWSSETMFVSYISVGTNPLCSYSSNTLVSRLRSTSSECTGYCISYCSRMYSPAAKSIDAYHRCAQLVIENIMRVHIISSGPNVFLCDISESFWFIMNRDILMAAFQTKLSCGQTGSKYLGRHRRRIGPHTWMCWNYLKIDLSSIRMNRPSYLHNRQGTIKTSYLGKT